MNREIIKVQYPDYVLSECIDPEIGIPMCRRIICEPEAQLYKLEVFYSGECVCLENPGFYGSYRVVILS